MVNIKSITFNKCKK